MENRACFYLAIVESEVTILMNRSGSNERVLMEALGVVKDWAKGSKMKVNAFYEYARHRYLDHIEIFLGLLLQTLTTF